MRSRELAALAAAVLASASVGGSGCVSNPDPRPRSLTTIQSDAHGGYAVVEVDRQFHRGELIAIGPEGVWVLVGGSLVRTPLERVSEIEVYPYDVSLAGVAGWGLLGTLSTISHGFFLVFTAPIWIVTATVTGASHSRSALKRYTPDSGSPDDLAKWARFPQGMPPGVTATELFHGRRAVAPPGPPSSVAPVGPPAPGQPAPPGLPPTQLTPPPAQPAPQPPPAQPAPQPPPAQPAPQPWPQPRSP